MASRGAEFAAALRVIPTLPPPLLSRFVACAIERLDELEGDTDLEEDDHDGGNVDDQGEEEYRVSGVYGIDQTAGILRPEW